MKFLSLFGALLLTLQCFSQEQKGYYITIGGQKVEGVFKTTYFHDAKSLQFRNQGGEFRTLTTEDIKEYGIGSEYKFIRQTVKMESGSEKILSGTKDPYLEVVTVFLNVVVEGDASLYSYENDGDVKFFFRVKGKQDDIVPLIYKKYQPSPTGGVKENNRFRQQLYTTLNCRSFSSADYENIEYDKSDLRDFFTLQNQCLNSKTIIFSNTASKKPAVKYTLGAGAYGVNFAIDGDRYFAGKAKGNSYGINAEAALVTASEKWEVFARVEYMTLSAKKTGVFDAGYNIRTTTHELNANCFDFNFGPRYNFQLDDHNKIIIDAAFGFFLPSGEVEKTTVLRTDTGVEYDGEEETLKLSASVFGSFGIGYVFKDKFGIILRYDMPRNMFDNTYFNQEAKISRLGLNLRYTLN